MVVKTAVVAEAKRESRCHLHRKSFSLLRTRRSGFLILDKTQFHSIPCRVQGRSCLLEAVFGTYCLYSIATRHFLCLLREYPHKSGIKETTAQAMHLSLCLGKKEQFNN